MSRISPYLFLLLNLLLVQCSGQSHKNTTGTDAPLKYAASISLPGVQGRIDHLSYNKSRHLLYVAALGNNTVEVVDLKAQKVIHTIESLDEPQGIQYIPGSNVIFVANGADGSCAVFDAGSYKEISSTRLNGDADNVRYDEASKRIYVGYGNGGISIIDALAYNQTGDIKLPGHPESFQLDPAKNRLYVNVPGARQVDVIDLDSETIIETWKIEEARSNFPMALDTAHHRLFIGCRHPSELLVIDDKTGKILASPSISGDADDIFYDRDSRLLYVICGEGYVDIFRQISADRYELESKVKTRPGARTGLFVPELNRLFVAAPARAGHEACILVFDKK